MFLPDFSKPVLHKLCTNSRDHAGYVKGKSRYARGVEMSNKCNNRGVFACNNRIKRHTNTAECWSAISDIPKARPRRNPSLTDRAETTTDVCIFNSRACSKSASPSIHHSHLQIPVQVPNAKSLFNHTLLSFSNASTASLSWASLASSIGENPIKA